MSRFPPSQQPIRSRLRSNRRRGGDEVKPKPPEHFHAFAARYLETARGAASKTSAIAILWLVAVLVSWWSIESEVIAQTDKAAVAAKEYSDAAKRHQEAMESLQSSELRTGLKDNAKQAELDAAEKQISSAAANLQASKNGVVEFKLPTFPSFKIGTRVAPGILSAIVLVLAVYLTQMRETTYRYLSLYLRTKQEQLQERIDRIGEVLGPRLWWLSPLPNRSGAVVAASDFAQALGWHQPSNATRWQISLFWLALLAVQARATYLGVAFLDEFVATSLLRRTTDLTLIRALQLAYVFLLGLSCSLAIAWLWPRRVPDQPIEFPHDARQNRRQALIHVRNAAFLVIASQASTARWLRSALTRFLRKTPRFKTRKPLASVAGADGLRHNRRSHILHLATEGHLVGLRNPRLGVWRNDRVDVESSAATARFNRSAITPAAQYASSVLFAAGQVDAGLRLLFDAIREDFGFKEKARVLWLPKQQRKKPRPSRESLKRSSLKESSRPFRPQAVPVPAVSVRLYDLLATQAAKNNRPKILAELIEFVTIHKLDAVLSSRIAAWSEASTRMNNVR